MIDDDYDQFNMNKKQVEFKEHHLMSAELDEARIEFMDIYCKSTAGRFLRPKELQSLITFFQRMKQKALALEAKVPPEPPPELPDNVISIISKLKRKK